jgi:hypothetical protein
MVLQSAQRHTCCLQLYVETMSCQRPFCHLEGRHWAPGIGSIMHINVWCAGLPAPSSCHRSKGAPNNTLLAASHMYFYFTVNKMRSRCMLYIATGPCCKAQPAAAAAGADTSRCCMPGLPRNGAAASQAATEHVTRFKRP